MRFSGKCFGLKKRVLLLKSPLTLSITVVVFCCCYSLHSNMDQVMNNMNQIFGQVGGRMGRPNMDPFGMMAGGPATAGMMNPFGMLDNMLMPSMQANQLMNPMSNQSQMSTMMMGGGMPGTQSYSYSSSIQYSNDGTGRPRVVERTSSAMCGANGLRETQATHRDTRTGEPILQFCILI